MQRRTFLAAAAGGWVLRALPLSAQDRSWKAHWIHPHSADLHAYGVYHFRRSFDLATKPEHCSVHVSGDSRYILYVNGVQVSRGPARGDFTHWRYETVDLAPQLRNGRNVIAAVVWNDGDDAPLAQWSNETAFLIQPEDPAQQDLLATGKGWKAIRNAAYHPYREPGAYAHGYFALGACEQFDSSQHPWNWAAPDFDDAAWPVADVGRNASVRDHSDAPTRWMLVPRSIPPMEETPVRLAKVRKAEGVQPPAAFPASAASFTIPANTKATLLLDNATLTCAYPVVTWSGGKSGTLSFQYAESLYQQLRPRTMKGNRDEVEGKQFVGYGDRVLADGARRTWQPLYWRTFRYLQLTVTTQDDPLTLEDLSAIYTGYPFEVKAKFDSGDPLHQKMMETGWRTARLCAHETYMDCPYYEQLQYVGDTRIQAMVSLFMTGDRRLVRNAIELINDSRTAEGATYSRAPSTLQQYIPPFSLWWIGMLRDYWWYTDDPQFVKSMLPGVRSVLTFYEGYLSSNDLLGAMPWWNYVDWVEGWPSGRPPSEQGTMPCTIQLQYLLALGWAAELEQHLGDPVFSRRNTELASRLKQKIQQTFWAADRKIYTEDKAHQHGSQHANSLAVLAGLLSPADAKELMPRIAADTSLAKCSVYFRYYLDLAMIAAGHGDRYLERLDTWKGMLAEGLTTWAETDNPYTRSDCHAWGASPNIEFLRTVLGVDSAAPGFGAVRIRPHLGPLQRAAGVVPHPKGVIEVTVTRKAGKVDVQYKAPAGVKVTVEA